jgi:aspartyl-tRNA(Asn)/glutamyl-tRNA(Gln) amidotransferase subunit B
MAANFILGDLASHLNTAGVSIGDAPVKPAALAAHVTHALHGEISVSAAKKSFPDLWENSYKPIGEVLAQVDKAAIPQSGMGWYQAFLAADPNEPAGRYSFTSTATISIANLWQTVRQDEVEAIVDEVLKSNAKQVEDYRAGKEKAFNSLVGQVMKATKGKANPAQVNEILRRRLSA